MIWLNLRTGCPGAMGWMASLWPAETSLRAVRCRPLRDWPAAIGLRATTTSSELPSLRVWWLKLFCYLSVVSRANLLFYIREEYYWYDHTLLYSITKGQSPTPIPAHFTQSLLSKSDSLGLGRQSTHNERFSCKVFQSCDLRRECLKLIAHLRFFEQMICQDRQSLSLFSQPVKGVP